MSSEVSSSRVDEGGVRSIDEPPREDALRDLYSALEMLPAEQTSALQQARKICPELVKTESDGMLFLRHEKFNYWKAAESLANYWKERRSLFGEDRAFLPLTQTGRGALTENDALSVQSGMFVMLPKTSTGQCVVLSDRSRALASATIESKMRSIWYILDKVTHEAYAQTRGVLVFSLLVAPKVASLDRIYVNRMASCHFSFPSRCICV